MHRILTTELEKRVDARLSDLALHWNPPGHESLRLLPMPAELFTELDAIRLLNGPRAERVASGGVCGAGEAVWLGIDGAA